MKKFQINIVVCTLIVAFVGCVPARHVPLYYDASNPLKHVAVLPMKNDTTDVDGPNVVRKKMIEALENKSYVVQDVKETDQILRDRMGITLGGQLDLTTPQKLGETLGVEGVLYGTLLDFNETTTGVLDVRKVRAQLKLVNTMTGQTLWQRGLGVRSEIRMSGKAGAAATVIGRASDARDKDAPWVTIESTTTDSDNLGRSFAMELGAKLFTKAIGLHLDYESSELARRITRDLPWGPGPSAAKPTLETATPLVSRQDTIISLQSSFAHIDYGRKDFTAMLVSTSTNQDTGNSYQSRIPLAKAGKNLRMDMDFSQKLQEPSVFSKVSIIHRGDKNISYTLYPSSHKYLSHSDEVGNIHYEKPRVHKTRIGREFINGHPTIKYRVDITNRDGRKEKGFIWEARDLDNMTIKSEIEHDGMKVVTEIKNIVLKTPPASLFEIPPGYQEAKNINDLMTKSK